MGQEVDNQEYRQKPKVAKKYCRELSCNFGWKDYQPPQIEKRYHVLVAVSEVFTQAVFLMQTLSEDAMAHFLGNDLPILLKFLELKELCNMQRLYRGTSKLGIESEITMSTSDLWKLWARNKLLFPSRWKPKTIVVETIYLELVRQLSLIYSCTLVIRIPLKSTDNTILLSTISLCMDMLTDPGCTIDFELETKRVNTETRLDPYTTLKVSRSDDDGQIRKSWLSLLRQAQRKSDTASILDYNLAYDMISTPWKRIKANLQLKIADEECKVARIYRRSLREGEINPLWHCCKRAHVFSDSPGLRYDISDKTVQKKLWIYEYELTMSAFFTMVESLNQEKLWDSLIRELGFEHVVLLVREAHVRNIIENVQKESHQNKEQRSLSILRKCLPKVTFKILNGRKLICNDNHRWVIDAKNVKFLAKFRKDRRQAKIEAKMMKAEDVLQRAKKKRKIMKT